MSREFFKRLTPIVPGEPGVFHAPALARVVTGFVSGGPTEGRGFPQWGASGSGKAHFFGTPVEGYSQSWCGKVEKHYGWIMLAGNFARCRECERRYTKALREGKVEPAKNATARSDGALVDKQEVA